MDQVKIDYGQLKQALREVLDERGATSHPELAARFKGGTVVIKPRDHTQQPKELPIEELFKKIVRVRDQLRVLEQKINSTESLTSEDRATMQGYVTRSYGTLTTFNVLFADKDDWFVGQKGK